MCLDIQACPAKRQLTIAMDCDRYCDRGDLRCKSTEENRKSVIPALLRPNHDDIESRNTSEYKVDLVKTGSLPLKPRAAALKLHRTLGLIVGTNSYSNLN